jgi:hypothetical protein
MARIGGADMLICGRRSLFLDIDCKLLAVPLTFVHYPFHPTIYTCGEEAAVTDGRCQIK